MSKIDHPVQSIASLLKAFVLAFIVATILLVTVVLPIEFGVDPTGLGTRLGLTNMLAADFVPEIVNRPVDSVLPSREDTVEILLPARDGLEYKFFLNQYASLNYQWTSTGPVYFDLHGEPEVNANGYFESYAEAKLSEMRGTITTPFAGSHGWYFRNDTETDATVTLKTKGNYSVIGLK
ncbi:MAG: hypothetical protein EXR84_00050 [Gammaproteobacteria bacterium]|nr:hypothetical protein [Gammaproteobacteria bacterium]